MAQVSESVSIGVQAGNSFCRRVTACEPIRYSFLEDLGILLLSISYDVTSYLEIDPRVHSAHGYKIRRNQEQDPPHLQHASWASTISNL